MKLNAKELRDVDEGTISRELRTMNRKPIYFILENIYDTYNIGGLFRLADALSIEKMYLCGQMEVPPNSRIKKASIGTYKVVTWEYKQSAVEAIRDLSLKFKIQNSKFNSEFIILNSKLPVIKIIAVEQDKKALPYTKADYSFPLALVFGNETSGVTKEVLALVDQIVEIPMWGINKSLNVIVSAAIVSYFAISNSPWFTNNKKLKYNYLSRPDSLVVKQTLGKG